MNRLKYRINKEFDKKANGTIYSSCIIDYNGH